MLVLLGEKCTETVFLAGFAQVLLTLQIFFSNFITLKIFDLLTYKNNCENSYSH